MSQCWSCGGKKEERDEGQRHGNVFLSGDGRKEMIRFVWMKQRMGKEGSITVVMDVIRSTKRTSDLFMEVEMCVRGVGRKGRGSEKEEITSKKQPNTEGDTVKLGSNKEGIMWIQCRKGLR